MQDTLRTKAPDLLSVSHSGTIALDEQAYEVIINDAKAQDIDALPLRDSNLTEESIKIKVWDEHQNDAAGMQGGATTLRHTIDLGAKNKITSVTYGGGDTGGGNATYSYSYRNFNKLDYKYQ